MPKGWIWTKSTFDAMIEQLFTTCRHDGNFLLPALLKFVASVSRGLCQSMRVWKRLRTKAAWNRKAREKKIGREGNFLPTWHYNKNKQQREKRDPKEGNGNFLVCLHLVLCKATISIIYNFNLARSIQLQLCVYGVMKAFSGVRRRRSWIWISRAAE